MVACTQLFPFFFLFVLTGYHFRMMSVYLPFLRPLLRFLCSSLRAVSPFRAFYPLVLQRDRPSVYKFKYLYIHPSGGFHLRVFIPSDLLFYLCVLPFSRFPSRLYSCFLGAASLPAFSLSPRPYSPSASSSTSFSGLYSTNMCFYHFSAHLFL